MIDFKSLLPQVAIPHISITEFILREADRVPDRDALIDGRTGRTYCIWTIQRDAPLIRWRPCCEGSG